MSHLSFKDVTLSSPKLNNKGNFGRPAARQPECVGARDEPRASVVVWLVVYPAENAKEVVVPLGNIGKKK